MAQLDPTLFFFAVIGLCEFLFSARPLLERAFGESIDADLVERFSAQIAELVIGGVRGRLRRLSQRTVAPADGAAG